ncbi:MAG TPA: DUF4337 family protein [Urbifossiella sp.]|jgi:hypothetical protein|nr:DUF4337 family protein [Urbifossiella sp.]
MSSPHEHIEHAEHDGHLAGNPFDRRVAVSVAVVAALLAGLSMIGHRKHNEVLQLLGDANRLTAEAGIGNTQASNAWAEYQAVNVRDHGYEFAGDLLKRLADAKPEYAPVVKDAAAKASGQHTKYAERLPALKDKAEKLTADGEGKQRAALEKMDAAHHAHDQADRLDVAHLAAEIGIVLCSLALLTKRRAFWFVGLVTAALSIGLAASAYAIPHHPHPPAAGAAH